MAGRILIDMDGTIADLDGSVEREFKKMHPDKNWNSKRTEFEFNEEIEPFAREIVAKPRFFASLEPIPGAIEAIKRLDKNGFDIWFCTSPLREYIYCVPEKFEWIEKNFGFEWTRKIIIVKDKTLVNGNWLIDDKEQTGKEKPKWEQIIFNQSYNQHVKKRRLYNWNEIDKLLLM